MSVHPLRPERSASANSATSAMWRLFYQERMICQPGFVHRISCFSHAIIFKGLLIGMNISNIAGNTLTIYTGLLVYGFFLFFCIFLIIYFHRSKLISSLRLISNNVWGLYASGILQVVRLLFLGLTFSTDSIFKEIFPLLARYAIFLDFSIYFLLFFPILLNKSNTWIRSPVLLVPLLLGF